MNSTSTKLDVINTALINLGDRRVDATNSSQASELASAILPEVLMFISNRHFWFFTNKYLITDPTDPNVEVTYSADTVELIEPVVRLLGVYSSIPGSLIRQACFIQPKDYDARYYSTAMSSDDDVVIYYTTTASGSIKLYPYPNSDTSKSRLRLEVYQYIPTPTLDSDVFEVPEIAIPMVTTLLTAKLASRLLNNIQSAQVYEAQYEVLHRKLVETGDVKPRQYRWSVL